jgi:murein DD-endopeptidase MepM/ murein hydrolase activator NlpD
LTTSLALGGVFLSFNYVNAQESAEVALEPGVSNFSIAQKTADPITSDGCVNVTGGALLPCVSNPGTIGGVNDGTDQISVYVIRKGDSIAQIAKMFNVSANTILWANDMKKGDKLAEGDTLIILPMDGIKHVVVKGDTLKKIAEKYKIDVSDIVSVNDITIDTQLNIGQELIIPDVEMNDEGGDKPVANLAASIKKDQDYYASHPIKNASGYFINPLPNGHKTQGLHDHSRAIDIGAPTGTPIYAAASGTVSFAKVGRNGGYGNLVIIDHPNGTQTYYAHQSKLAVRAGDKVSQGQVIGYVGSTGHSTGPHLHFEVRGARNPGADWSWKR